VTAEPGSRHRIVAFGDLVNDIVVMPREAIRADTDTTSTIRMRPGGSAANTAAWLGSLGSPVDFVGCVGTSDAELHRGFFRDLGVEPHLVVAPGIPTSTIVIIVDGQHRTMLTERGANAALAVSDLPDSLLAEASVLHLTGYSLHDGPRAAGFRELIERAHAAGVTVSLNAGSAGFIADYGPADFVDAIAGADILFANADEAALLCEEDVPERIVTVLGDRHGLAVVTHGAEPVLVAERGQKVHTVPVPTVRMVDTTGAGDAMAAGFLHEWVSSRDAVAAAAAGVATASRAIMVTGGRPVL
jgi:sugar/nucleoside kinase (ribokinase family)